MSWISKGRNVAFVHVRGFLGKLMNDIVEALWTLEEGRLAAKPEDFALRLATHPLPDRLDTSTGVNSLQVSDDQHSCLPHVYQKTRKQSDDLSASLQTYPFESLTAGRNLSQHEEHSWYVSSPFGPDTRHRTMHTLAVRADFLPIPQDIRIDRTRGLELWYT